MQIIARHNIGNCKKIKEGQVPSQSKKEIGETSVERPERMLLQMHQKHQKGTKQIAQRRKKLNSNVLFFFFFKE